jgi:membrane-associated phospholipid phosphatase
MEWKKYFSNSLLKIEFFLTIFLLIIILIFLTRFLNWVELREGVVLNDPILRLFSPIDLTWLIFFLIYVSLFLGVVIFVKSPDILILALQSYIIMVFIRILMMYLLPLNPPEKSILLIDPVVKYFGTGKNLTKDLFFSGHTATLFLLFLVADKKWLKVIFLISTILVAAGVLLQHVHYSIDVAAAFFFSYCSYKIAQYFHFKVSAGTS